MSGGHRFLGLRLGNVERPSQSMLAGKRVIRESSLLLRGEAAEVESLVVEITPRHPFLLATTVKVHAIRSNQFSAVVGSTFKWKLLLPVHVHLQMLAAASPRNLWISLPAGSD